MGSLGHPPSLEQIRDHLGVSATSTIHEHVARLIEKGYLSKEWNKARSIELTKALGQQRSSRLLPVEGRLIAGRPLQGARGPDEVSVPADLPGGGDAFVLIVGDDSLSEHEIRRNDMLVVAKRGSPSRAERLLVIEDDCGSVDLLRATSDDEAGSASSHIIGEIVGLIRKDP